MPIVEMRQATKEDLPALEKLIHSSIRELYSKIYPKGVVDFFIEYHDLKHITQNATEGITLVIEESGSIVATCHLIGNTMGGLYVDAKHQNKGYATKLCLELMYIAKSKGLDHVILDATLMSKSIFDKFGFETTEFLYQPMDNGDRLYYFKMRKTIIE